MSKMGKSVIRKITGKCFVGKFTNYFCKKCKCSICDYADACVCPKKDMKR